MGKAAGRWGHRPLRDAWNAMRRYFDDRRAGSLCALRVSRPANYAGTNRRRVRDAAPYGEVGNPLDCQCAAARGCNEYEVLVLSCERTIQFQQRRRAARYILPESTSPPANTTPVLRDVRRAIKIFSCTGRGAFFFIFEKEWGAQRVGRVSGPYGVQRKRRVTQSPRRPTPRR